MKHTIVIFGVFFIIYVIIQLLYLVRKYRNEIEGLREQARTKEFYIGDKCFVLIGKSIEMATINRITFMENNKVVFTVNGHHERYSADIYNSIDEAVEKLKKILRENHKK